MKYLTYHMTATMKPKSLIIIHVEIISKTIPNDVNQQ